MYTKTFFVDLCFNLFISGGEVPVLYDEPVVSYYLLLSLQSQI